MATIDPEKRILRLKPGMTGLWQVSRSPSSEAINYDLEYIERWSLFLDIKIMLKTIIGVLFNN
jgi:lipopolysaccharide/colanic/teichoic acid biosynthesis glycosyltransferase